MQAVSESKLLNTMGKRVRVLRDEKDWSQTGMASMLESYGVNVTPSHLSLVEKGKRNVSVELLVALAKLLDTTADYLLVLSDEPHPVSEPIGPEYSSLAQRAARAIDDLPSDEARETCNRLIWTFFEYVTKQTGRD